MTVTVRLPTVLRPHAGGKTNVEVTATDIGGVVRGLVDQYPAMGTHLVAEDGSLHRFVNVYVNDEDIRYLNKADTTVADGDEVAILPAVAGG